MSLPRSRSLATRGLRLLAYTEERGVYTSTQRVIRLTPINLAANTSNNYTISSIRPFSQSSSLLKKTKNAPPKRDPAAASSSAAASDPENLLDLSSLLAAYTPLDSHHKAQLHEVLHGGRFSPDKIGAVFVPVKSPEDGSVVSHPLRELAQIVPRSGRIISLLVNDREYIKPIMSAIQASKEYNQQPQRAEDNELELLLKVEMERKDALVRRVKETCQSWKDKVRLARTKQEKVWKELKKNGQMLPDVFKKAEKELQKVQDKKMKEIDQEEAQTIKQLDRH